MVTLTQLILIKIIWNYYHLIYLFYDTGYYIYYAGGWLKNKLTYRNIDIEDDYILL